MSATLSQAAKEIITEEEALLSKVVKRLTAPKEHNGQMVDYNDALITVRDALAEAREEDQPQLLEQMARLQAIAAQRGRGASIPIDPQNPYFGHLRLKEEGRFHDVLIGKHTFLDAESGIKIVDWRNAPVSKIYYCYDEGDDYEEEVADRTKEGVVIKRRSLSIESGELKRIASSGITLLKKKDGWQNLTPESIELSGGQGTAVRPQGLSILGIGADGRPRLNYHLPEISALIDKNQFGLITNNEPGILVVRGSAGSGKTTVALHRVAYLLFADKKRYTPDKVLVIVGNKALALYTSQVLPALGIKNIKVSTYHDWAHAARKRITKSLPDRYNSDTPPAVSRLKRHPLIIKYIVALEKERSATVTAEFERAFGNNNGGRAIINGWQNLERLPYEQRRQLLIEIMQGRREHKNVPDLKNLPTQIIGAAINILERYPYGERRLIQDWADIITSPQKLKNLSAQYAPDEFTAEDFENIASWNRELYARLVEEANSLAEETDEEDMAAIDQEDNTILLALYQHNVGRLPGVGGKMEYNHLMVDEVQDFSPFEVRVMLRSTAKDATITLAGDDAQAIIAESSFKGWEPFLRELGGRDVTMEQLAVAYRSTAEIMEVAQAVLGASAPKQLKATRHGAPVELHRFSDTGQAIDFLAGALRGLMMREPMASVAIIARHSPQAQTYYAALKKAEVPKLRLVAREDFSFSPGIDVTEIRQVKGLEFDYVILVEVNSDTYPEDDFSRHFLHVGLTRAAHQLWCLSGPNPSPLLPQWLLDKA